MALPQPGGLLNVGSYGRVLAQEMGHFEPDPTLEAVEVDIHTDDALLISPKDQIQRAIQRERVKWQGLKATHESPSALAAELLEKAEIPSFSELEAEQVSDLECLRRPRKESREFLKKKFAESNFLTEDMLKKADPNEPLQPVSEDEVVLNVAIYHPEKHTRTQEFLVLGSQKLTELRDILYCLNDHIFDGPNLKSGYFFIENVFYNDLRDPTSIDYSQPIVDWVNSRRAASTPSTPTSATQRPSASTTTTSSAGGTTSQVPLESFTSRRMEEVTFSQLNLRIGAPYLYVHQGNCEHLLVFTELRRIHCRTSDEQPHALDPLDRRLYPRLTFQGKVRRRKCSVCRIHPARYITVRDRLAPEPNCLYCDQCYRIFHYDAEGKLLYSDFEVYPYYHE